MLNPNQRLLSIQDISNFVVALYAISSKPMVNEWNVDPDEAFDDYLTWVVGHILTTHFGMRVIGYYRKESEYLNIFEQDADKIKALFFGSTDAASMAVYKGYDVKVLVTGPDLFIARRIRRYH